MKKQSEKAGGKKKNNMQGKKRGKSRRRRNILVISLAVIVPVLCLLAVYTVGVVHYRNRFLRGTVIDHVDVSGMAIPELEEQIMEYSLRVIERQAEGPTLEEEILGSDIGISYVSTEPLQDVLRGQNPYLWFLNRDSVYETETLYSYKEDALEAKIGGLKGFQEEFIQEPADAYIADYVPGSGFELVAENRGNRLNREKTIEAIKEAVDRLEEKVDLEEAGCYEEPAVTAEDDGLRDVYAKLQNYANVAITYTFGTEKEVLDGDTITGWITVAGNRITFDRTAVEEYVASLRKKYDTIFRPRKFQTSYGAEVTIDQGDYGWWMDTPQETEELIGMLERGESGERTPVYRQTAASHETPDYGNTYVEINLTAQHLLLYQDGECILESDFVSGNPSRGNATPTGVYGITYKERDATLKGENYRTPVSYWMPFNNNVGMHDAGWRSEFGGTIYRTNGSHGCINLPYSVAQEIYGYVEKGTPVICYYLPGTEPAAADPGTGSVEGTGADPEAGQPEGTVADPGTAQPEGTVTDPGTGQPAGTAADPGTVQPEGTVTDPGITQPTGATADPGTSQPAGDAADPGQTTPEQSPAVVQ